MTPQTRPSNMKGVKRIVGRGVTLKLFSFLQLVHSRLPYLGWQGGHWRRTLAFLWSLYQNDCIKRFKTLSSKNTDWIAFRKHFSCFWKLTFFQLIIGKKNPKKKTSKIKIQIRNVNKRKDWTLFFLLAFLGFLILRTIFGAETLEGVFC